MRPWVNRLTFPSGALQFAGDIILNLTIAAGTIALLTFGVLLFTY